MDITTREFARSTASIIKTFVERALAPLNKRIEKLDRDAGRLGVSEFWLNDFSRRVCELEARAPGASDDNAHRVQRLSEHVARLETRLAKLEREQ